MTTLDSIIPIHEVTIVDRSHHFGMEEPIPIPPNHHHITKFTNIIMYQSEQKVVSGEKKFNYKSSQDTIMLASFKKLKFV